MPVTVEILQHAKDELKYNITSNGLKIDALDKRLDSVDKKIDSLNERVDSVDKKVDSLRSEMNSKFDMVDSKFDTMDSKFEDIKAMLTKVLSKVEEQENRNKFILDGHADITARQDRLETEVNERLKNIEDAVFSKRH